MRTVVIFYEREIPDSYQNIFIVKTQSYFVDFSDKLISNNFFGVKMDFHFHTHTHTHKKKMEQLVLMLLLIILIEIMN